LLNENQRMESHVDAVEGWAAKIDGNGNPLEFALSD
jgi:hypothetical protein